jgi:hypothetical protein
MAEFTEWTRNFLFSSVSKPDIIPHQSTNQWVLEAFLWGYIRHLQFILYCGETSSPFSSYIFLARIETSFIASIHTI